MGINIWKLGVVGSVSKEISDEVSKAAALREIPFMAIHEYVDAENSKAEGTFYTGTSLDARAEVQLIRNNSDANINISHSV